MRIARSKRVSEARGRARLSFLFAGLLLAGAWRPARAERAGSAALDLNYPGVGVRYFLQNQSALEARGQFLGGTKLGGARFYQYLTDEYQKMHGLDLFLGLEADYISFKGNSAVGTGAAGEFFVGGEYFFSRALSLQVDGGPAYMSLKDTGTSLGVSRFDVVVNFGINLYFGRDYWSGSSEADSSYSSPAPSSRPSSKTATPPAKAVNPDEVTP